MTAGNTDRATDLFGGGRTSPLVWVLNGHRVGDNHQVSALADALGWQRKDKILDWSRPLPRWSPFYGRQASLKHLTSEARTAFAPPWPDLVLSIGWRSVPVARWIQSQSKARLVHLGRPRAPLRFFDLVLSTPQYRLPEAENVLQLAGPISALTPDRLASAAHRWTPRLGHLPRPWTAVLLGGDAPPLRFPPAVATTLATACDELAAAYGGSLLVATGPRTPRQSAAAFLSGLIAPYYAYEWGKDPDNPYAAFLALADRFVVTSDSISMAHEAVERGRPLHIFPLPTAKARIHEALRRADRSLRREGAPMHRIYRGLLRSGVVYPPRTGSDYFEGLIRNGRANLLGNPEVLPAVVTDMSEKARAVHAVHALFQNRVG